MSQKKNKKEKLYLLTTCLILTFHHSVEKVVEKRDALLSSFVFFFYSTLMPLLIRAGQNWQISSQNVWVEKLNGWILWTLSEKLKQYIQMLVMLRLLFSDVVRTAERTETYGKNSFMVTLIKSQRECQNIERIIVPWKPEHPDTPLATPLLSTRL